MFYDFQDCAMIRKVAGIFLFNTQRHVLDVRE